MNHQTPNNNRPLRMLLLRGEVQQVKRTYRGLRVRSGQAWVTVNGCDLVLKRGEELALDMPHDATVVSPVGHLPLVIELLGDTPCHPTIDLRLVTNTL